MKLKKTNGKYIEIDNWSWFWAIVVTNIIISILSYILGFIIGMMLILAGW